MEDPMPTRPAPQTWRLVELLRPRGVPCATCGQVHRYLTHMTTIGDCLPVLFPPNTPAPGNLGREVALFLVGPVEADADPGEGSRYHEVAERVRRSSIRCEGCGERFADLE